MQIHMTEYNEQDAITMIRGPFVGAKGVIMKVRGFRTKTYDIALFNLVGKILEKQPTSNFTLTKTK